MTTFPDKDLLDPSFLEIYSKYACNDKLINICLTGDPEELTAAQEFCYKEFEEVNIPPMVFIGDCTYAMYFFFENESDAAYFKLKWA
jgi:hypothetical protein